MTDYEQFCREFRDLDDFYNIDMNKSNYLSPDLLLKKKKIEIFINDLKTVVKQMETNECELKKINSVSALIDIYYNDNDDDDMSNFNMESDDDTLEKQLNERLNSMNFDMDSSMNNIDSSMDSSMNHNMDSSMNQNINTTNTSINPVKSIDVNYNTFMSGQNEQLKRIFKNENTIYNENYVRLSSVF